jgi:hypothetical protein
MEYHSDARGRVAGEQRTAQAIWHGLDASFEARSYLIHTRDRD